LANAWYNPEPEPEPEHNPEPEPEPEPDHNQSLMASEWPQNVF